MDLRSTRRGIRGDADGQAASEYVALVALVAVLLALAAGLTSGGVGGQLLAGLRQGLCRVSGGACARARAAGPDLAPCPLGRSVRIEELEGALGFVRLGSQETLSAVRGSDGRVTVMLAHGAAGGGELRAGARIGVGGRPLEAGVRASAERTWTSGRAWTFADAAAAHRFVTAYGAKATVGGRLLDELRSRCSLLCDALGWRPHPRLPEPDATYEEGGTTGALRLSFGLGPIGRPLALGDERARVVGRRLQRDGTATWYLRLTDTATAALELPFGRLAHTATERSLVSYTLDARGRPATFGLLTAVEQADEDGAAGGHGMRTSTDAGSGEVTELEGTLDLRDAANRAAAGGLLAALRGEGSLATLTVRAGALAARLAGHGQLDRRTYALARSEHSTGASAGLGVELGAGVERSARAMRLLSAETRLPGLPFLPRDDCRPA